MELWSSPPCCMAIESWMCYCMHLKKLGQFHLCCLHRLLDISWEDRVTNQELLCCVSLPGVEALIMKAQLRRTGHIMRMEDNRLPKQIFCCELAHGSRRQGGQTEPYKDSLQASDRPVVGWEHLAPNQSAWNSATHRGMQAFQEGWLVQLDVKCKARKERRTDPAAAQCVAMSAHQSSACGPNRGTLTSFSLRDRQL